ncbi:MAG: hypothetical protein KDB00_14385 [Planctomycetales bacterium]|nr:hypothetical protein [Planctomycetales bacterium]
MPRNSKRGRLGRLIERLEDRRLLAALSNDSAWTPNSSQPIFAVDAPEPSAYLAFTLNRNTLAPVLESVPLEFSLGPVEPTDLRPGRLHGELSLPTPGGDLAEFKLVETQIMDAALASKLSDVATYSGVTRDGRSTVRVTVTPNGLHARIRSDAGDFIVNRVIGDPREIYLSYYESDLAMASGDLFDADDTDEDEHGPMGTTTAGEAELPVGAPPPIQTTGPELRTYRLAVAATGEFTARHGGTVAAAQAKIVEAINDANDLYERELGIRFVLVDNTSIVYLDAQTDPYTNSSLSAMQSENQANLDAVIGDANYDVGHVFGTAGGGRSSIGVAGRSGVKARAVSANNLNSSTLTVSHEIGHQFSSRHTWNGSNGSCTAAQWNADFSMEPGSGSTIMSYGGFCGIDNVVTTRDTYFHSVSYDAIVDYVTTRIPSVGSIIATGNTAPIVDAGPDHTIPAGTPFQLDAAPAVDNEADPVTYNWEQRDLGTGQKALAAPDDGLGPLFRSYPKSSVPTRTLPLLTELLNNTTPKGEQLPTTNRTIHFRLNANDGRGGTASDEIVLTVVDTGNAFAVTSPNSAVDWPAHSIQTITWDVAGTDANGIDAATVDLMISFDGGFTFDTVLASNVPNNGSHDVVIPDTLTTNARIKVQPVGNIFFDVSDANFTISEAQITDDYGDAPAPYPVLLSDNGARHAIGGPVLGAVVDAEIDGQPSPLADGDGSDEDGLTITNPLVAGQTSDVSVSSPTGGALDLFFDFDGDGVLGNTTAEIFRTTISPGDTLIPISVPISAVADTYARLRISTAGGLTATGPAADGEVEDYRIQIMAATPVSVAKVQINDGGQQRSQLTSVTILFDGATNVSTAAFEIRNQSDNSLVPISTATETVDQVTAATITFLSGDNVTARATGNSLIDGNYHLQVFATEVERMEQDFHFGEVPADAFFRLLGDSDGDRDVDGQDFGRFALAFLKPSSDPAFDDAFDADGDGTIDGDDYGWFELRSLRSLPF